MIPAEQAEFKPTLYRRAFTLVEVMIALAIVSIALVGLIRLQIISINMIEASEVTTAGTFLAQEKLAERLAKGYPEKGDDYGTAQRNSRKFNWKVNVTDSDLNELHKTEIDGLRKVSVEVRWKQDNEHKKLQMATYVADRKLQ